jgi:hypothetical protein
MHTLRQARHASDLRAIEAVCSRHMETWRIAVAPRHDAEAVMLDFVNPANTGRRLIGRSEEAGLNEVG